MKYYINQMPIVDFLEALCLRLGVSPINGNLVEGSTQPGWLTQVLQGGAKVTKYG